jgi:hypothetical protein
MSIESDILGVWKALEIHCEYEAIAALGRTLAIAIPGVSITADPAHPRRLNVTFTMQLAGLVTECAPAPLVSSRMSRYEAEPDE